MHESKDPTGFNADFNALKLSGSNALQELKTATENCGQVIRQSQESYEQLLAKYNALKSRCDSSEVPKDTVVKEGVTDAYVVVLIDAHSHRFKGNLMCGTEYGGSQTAKLLKEAVAGYIADRFPGEQICRIDARVYANLKGLSLEVFEQYANRNSLFKKPNFPRGLGAFAAGFSRHKGSFDFMDVVDEQAVEKKITELFKLYIKDPQCRHVLFGASGSVKYVRVLQDHVMFSDRLTVIQRGLQDTSLMRLGLEGTAFLQVFDCLTESSSKYAVTDVHSGDFSDDCHGTDVEFKHPLADNTLRNTSTVMDNASKALKALASQLPAQGNPRRIPVNAAGHRLDPVITPPTAAQWELYKARNGTKKLCGAFHLFHSCDRSATCWYDHKSISPDVYNCLQYVLKESPCKDRGDCRCIGCTAGHICQHRACVGSKSKFCKFTHAQHSMDTTVTDWVEPVEDKIEPGFRRADENSSKGSIDSWTTTRTGILIDI